jgi:hypothetical protein
MAYHKPVTAIDWKDFNDVRAFTVSLGFGWVMYRIYNWDGILEYRHSHMEDLAKDCEEYAACGVTFGGVVYTTGLRWTN